MLPEMSESGCSSEQQVKDSEDNPQDPPRVAKKTMLHSVTVCPLYPVPDPAAAGKFKVALFVNVSKHCLEKGYGEFTWVSLAVRWV